jgi:demethylmenaquinone methyltransferase/2-methoxy-6-polyprenyl-1,4-benzoquinol methylase
MRGNTTRQDATVHDRTIRDMFAGIAGVYDRMNGLLSLGRDATWRRNLALAVDPAARDILDVCCGTGELILAVQALGRGSRHVAADFCLPMLQEGVRAHGIHHKAALLAADTQRLPLPGRTFDAVVVAFGLRNLGELDRGLAEIHRVLRPGGQLLVLEFFRPRRRWARLPVDAYLDGAVPLLGRLFGRDGAAYGYLPRSMGRFLSVEEFRQALREAGFAPEIEVEAQTLGISHLVAARRPVTVS